MRHFDIIILGAGASGLMAAAKYKDRHIALIESNAEIGQKIKISGGGRCNITNQNVSTHNYLGDASFIAAILKAFDHNALLAFLKMRGCRPVLQKEQQYFCKESAKEIISVFANEIQGLPLFLNQKISNVTKKEEDFFIDTHKEQFCAKKVIIATGGLSYPKIGASSIAYDIAKQFGHTVMTTAPSLVGFTVQKEQFWMKTLSGISLPVSIKAGNRSIDGDLLFAHKGISGPAVLNASLYWQKGKLSIDFMPQHDLKKLLKPSKKFLSSALALPKRFAKAFLESLDIKDKAVDDLTEEERTKLLSINAYSFAPAGNFGYTKAEVTRGGISTDEINPETMMSRLIDDLYFLGECLDVTGELGGYNFQWAFSSAQRLTL